MIILRFRLKVGGGLAAVYPESFSDGRKYEATIEIVSKDSKAKDFPVQINPDNA